MIKGGETTKKAYCSKCMRIMTWTYVAGTLASYWKCLGCGMNRSA
ncbi:MAG TPA: hypothetical protein VGB00_15205 [Pyrinomonadaceae bacterium]